MSKWSEAIEVPALRKALTLGRVELDFRKRQDLSGARPMTEKVRIMLIQNGPASHRALGRPA